MGLYCQSNGANLYLSGSFVQHNWLLESEIPSAYRGTLSRYYNSEFAYTANDGQKYLNMGVFFVSDTDDFPITVVEPIIHDSTGRDCGFISETMLGHVGTCYTLKGSAGTQSQVEGPEYSSSQHYTIPRFSFDFTTKNYIPNNGGNEYCYYDSGVVNISFEKSTQDATFDWDPMILTVEKMGIQLPYTVTMNDVDYTGDIIHFADTGNYTVHYTYTDPYNYDEATNQYESRTYSKVVNLSVTAIPPEVVVYHPDFSYVGDWNRASRVVVINNKSYVMPDISNTSGIFGSTTISGQTVYYPIVTLQGRSSSNGDYSSGEIYFFAPAFNSINIKDYNQTDGSVQYEYNASKQTWPHNNTSTTMPTNNNNLRSFEGEVFGVKGVSPGNTNAPWLSDCNVDNPNSAKAGKVQYTNGLGLCFVTAGIGRDAPKNGDSQQLTEFYYVGNDGIRYYYYIRYDYKQTKYQQSGCFASGTLITLADGTQKPIEELTAEDRILAWDFFTGTLVEEDISLLVNHGDDLYQVKTLRFSDGTELRLIADHGVFDYDLNRFVYLDESNCAEYLGHHFAKPGTDGSVELVTLESLTVTEEYTGAWSISSAGTSNALAEGLLTVAPPEDFYNWIAMGDKMRYDEEQFARDVETYGLYTYEDFADYVTEEQFEQWNGAYLKIAVEKGYFTFEYILELIEMYKQWMP